MTVYSPKGKNTGAAVVVFPGGGYQTLAIDLEGTEVCDWLTPRGITCVLLKYRVTEVGPYPKSGPYPESPMALEDAQRTVGLVRFHAAEWHVDPHKIGVLGFSSGGHLVAAMSTHFTQRLYPAVDASDKESCRPDFAVAIYPGHLSLAAAEWDARQGTKKFVIPHPEHETTADRQYGLNPDLHVTAQTPPTFLLQAEDDHVDNVNDSLAYYIALKKAGVPVEMHLYAQGGHAFGLRRTNLPITAWPQLVDTWLETIGMISDYAHNRVAHPLRPYRKGWVAFLHENQPATCSSYLFVCRPEAAPPSSTVILSGAVCALRKLRSRRTPRV
jgi:acetyl esterase/lipase